MLALDSTYSSGKAKATTLWLSVSISNLIKNRHYWWPVRQSVREHIIQSIFYSTTAPMPAFWILICKFYIGFTRNIIMVFNWFWVLHLNLKMYEIKELSFLSDKEDTYSPNNVSFVENLATHNIWEKLDQSAQITHHTHTYWRECLLSVWQEMRRDNLPLTHNCETDQRKPNLQTCKIIQVKLEKL